MAYSHGNWLAVYHTEKASYPQRKKKPVKVGVLTVKMAKLINIDGGCGFSSSRPDLFCLRHDSHGRGLVPSSRLAS